MNRYQTPVQQVVALYGFLTSANHSCYSKSDFMK